MKQQMKISKISAKPMFPRLLQHKENIQVIFLYIYKLYVKTLKFQETYHFACFLNDQFFDESPILLIIEVTVGRFH
jgi:hypothetical protein